MRERGSSERPDAPTAGGRTGGVSVMQARLIERRGEHVGQVYLLGQRRFRIGRAVGNDLVVINNVQVSRQHAVVEWDGQQYRLHDLGSKNGTFLNGQRLQAPRVLQLGDVIELPGLELVFQAGDETQTQPPAAAPPELALTTRELEVLRLLAQGLSSKEIAARLLLSVRTVDHHTSAIYAKLGVRGRAEAVALAVRAGLVSGPATP